SSPLSPGSALPIRARTRRAYSATLAAALPALAACAGPGAASTPTGTEAKAPLTLSVWHWDSYLIDPYKDLGADFTRRHPHVTFSVEPTPFAEFAQKLTAAIVAGSAPDVSGIAEGNGRISFASKGQFTDLGPRVRKDRFDLSDMKPFVKEQTWKGTLVGIPNHHAYQYWYYNQNLFQKEGVTSPLELWKQGKWDWNAYLETATKLTAGSGPDRRWGTAAVRADNQHGAFPLAAANGGWIFDDKFTRATLTSAACLDAWRFLYEMKKYAPGPEDGQTGTYELGRVGMRLNWHDRYVLQTAQVPFTARVLPPPSSPKTGKAMYSSSSTGLVLPKGSPSPDAGWEFIKFFVEPPSLTKIFQQVMNMPPRLSMRTKELWQKHPRIPDPDVLAEVDSATVNALVYMPKISNFPEMRQALTDEMVQVWADKQSLPDGLRKAEEQWNRLLKEGEVDPDVR
ncbi:MAG: sugar ABC transporter substrate-binding protein, partial [Chloroflexota bacterium]|nr:sugar ABC transporter substrate-binding protein [Chloroflexota bacterium]